MGKSISFMLEQKPRPEGKFKAFMHDHGRTIADGSSYVRLGLGIASAVAVLADKPQLAQRLHLLGVVTDKVDGVAAKMSKNGGTKAGGKLDQQVDKAFTAVTEAALTVKGDISVAHPALRTGRDVVMNSVVRPHYEQQGIETSAALAGQVSTAIVLTADNLSMTQFGREHKAFTRGMHWLATGLKWYSMADSPRVWEKRYAERSIQKERVVFEAA